MAERRRDFWGQYESKTEREGNWEPQRVDLVGGVWYLEGFESMKILIVIFGDWHVINACDFPSKQKHYCLSLAR